MGVKRGYRDTAKHVVLIAMAIGLLAAPGTGPGIVFAQDKPAAPAPAPKLDEMDAYKIRALHAEHRAMSLEHQERARAIDAKAQALNAAIAEAAAKAKVELKDGWRPDVDRKVWVK